MLEPNVKVDGVLCREKHYPITKDFGGLTVIMPSANELIFFYRSAKVKFNWNHFMLEPSGQIRRLGEEYLEMMRSVEDGKQNINSTLESVLERETWQTRLSQGEAVEYQAIAEHYQALSKDLKAGAELLRESLDDMFVRMDSEKMFDYMNRNEEDTLVEREIYKRIFFTGKNIVSGLEYTARRQASIAECCARIVQKGLKDES
ncbi:hypothetical protein JW711_05530 [Candidatus Woesearchaeota archaeon]|nr:hypothetical protein [Candidatus Woesearchaeota archaeon]